MVLVAVKTDVKVPVDPGLVVVVVVVDVDALKVTVEAVALVDEVGGTVDEVDISATEVDTAVLEEIEVVDEIVGARLVQVSQESVKQIPLSL